MHFDILTLFPDMVNTVLQESIIGRAQRAGHISVACHQIRDYSENKHHNVDDTPYGGGVGMVMAPGPIYACYQAVMAKKSGPARRRVIYLSPRGRVLTQQIAAELATYDELVLLCGHYEGVDERVIEEIVDEEISIGDYVLTGGELPACILVDAVSRLLDGVLSSPACYEGESIACGLLEYPQYTRPPVFCGREVPPVLLSGHHENIAAWRLSQSIALTKARRPDLYAMYEAAEKQTK